MAQAHPRLFEDIPARRPSNEQPSESNYCARRKLSFCARQCRDGRSSVCVGLSPVNDARPAVSPTLMFSRFFLRSSLLSMVVFCPLMVTCALKPLLVALGRDDDDEPFWSEEEEAAASVLSRSLHSHAGYSSSGSATGSGLLAWNPRPFSTVPAGHDDFAAFFAVVVVDGAATGVGLTSSPVSLVLAEASASAHRDSHKHLLLVFACHSAITGNSHRTDWRAPAVGSDSITLRRESDRPPTRQQLERCCMRMYVRTEEQAQGSGLRLSC